MSAAPRPAAVLWDMDGTLVDTEHYWFEAQTELVAEFGNGAWNDEHNHQLIGTDLRFAADYIQRHGKVPWELDRIVDHLSRSVAEKCAAAMPWRPGARRLLQQLHAEGIPCALVTMSWRELAMTIVDALPAGWFQHVVTGDQVINGKPHPEPYRRAAALLGVDPRECVALEDSPSGVASAIAAGCRTIATPVLVDVEPRPGLTILHDLTGLTPDNLLDPPDAHDPGVGTHGPRRKGALAIAGAVLLGAVGLAVATRSKDSPPPPPPIDIALEAWAPYWTAKDGAAAVKTHGNWLRRVSPFWFAATGVDSIAANEHVNADDAKALLKAAKARKVAVLPTVVDGTEAGVMARILADPLTRTRHVEALVGFVESGGFDGVDLDYENFAFVDDRSTWQTTKPNWVAFVTELGGRLRAQGRQLTVSVPPPTAYWVYDYAGIEPHVDAIRIMAYDYSVKAPGPIAPLDYVRTVINDARALTEDDSKLVLGVPLYGRNWVTSSTGTCPAGKDRTTTITQRGLAKLAADRGAIPAVDSVSGETTFDYQVKFSDGTNSCVQNRQVFVVDEQATRARIDLARTERLGGVSLWALGFDSPATWAAIKSLATDQSAPSTTSG